MEKQGLSDEEFKRVAPNLYRALTDQFKRENMIKITVYGIEKYVRSNGLDEISFIDSIDQRTPVFYYFVAKDKHGQNRSELFYPN